MALTSQIDRQFLLTFALSCLLFVGCYKSSQEASPPAEDVDAPSIEMPAQEKTESASRGSSTTARSATGTGSSETVELGEPALTAGIPGDGELTLEQIDTWLADARNHVPLNVQLPISLVGAKDMIKGLDENPMTRAKIELGRQLFFDIRLSADNTVSCASCHAPAFGYGKDTQFGVGIDDQTGNRNSPVAYNRIITDLQFWDGRAASLEEQAKGPIENPIEMGNTHESCVKTIKGIDGYVRQFDKVFPDEGITIDTIAEAIATFERTIVTGPAPYDYFEIVKAVESQYDEDEIAEDLEDEDPELYAKYQRAKAIADEKFSEASRRGHELFFSDKANCTACHTGANFSDELYHNLGVGMEVSEPDLGRFEISQNEVEKGAFKTPTVRNIVMTAPYMHDGSQATLEEVIEWYAKGGHANEHLSDKIKKLDLSDQDKADLVAFMKEGLTGDFPPVEEGRLPM